MGVSVVSGVLEAAERDVINDETCEVLLAYLGAEVFNRERAASACRNVAGLCTWVRAM